MTALRLGIIGSGLIADIVANAMEDCAEISLEAVASRRVEKAEEFAQNHRIGRVFNSYKELAAWDGIDAIYVATPTSAREEIAVEGAKKGKHMLAEKPFASFKSLQRITRTCKENGVAFLDATHFVHHPRTKLIKQEMEQRIGKPLAIRSCFNYPGMDPNNIRLDPGKEPTGAFGDMAWYSMRAALEYLAPAASLVKTGGFARRDPRSGAIIRAAGAMLFSDGSTSTWDVGYDCGALVMDLDILGERGMISLDDFVLDWEHNFTSEYSAQTARFFERSGITNPDGFIRVDTPSPQPQIVHMMKVFSALASDPRCKAAQDSMTISERTQALMDAVWAELIIQEY